MTLTVDFWQLVGLAVTLIGAFFALGKLLIGQTLAGLDARLESITDSLREIKAEQARATDKLNAVERDMLIFKAAVERDFVRREDHLRDLMTIRMTIENLSLKIDNTRLKGAP